MSKRPFLSQAQQSTAPERETRADDRPSEAETPRALLMRTLLARYHELRARLARRLGSPDLAADALHEVWLRLEAKHDLGPVGNPEAYLFHAAINTAKNLRRSASARQRLLPTDMATLAGMPDEAPDPATIAAARSALGDLQAALNELPLRQQTVFHETFLGDASQQDLANRFNVSVRTIQNDLHQAIDHCVRRLHKKIHFVSGPRRLSGNREGPSS
jgi:RNA polymerase sigma-70 factor (ECF subfamily)